MSDDWFDEYAAGDFLPGPGFPPQWADPVVIEMCDKMYNFGRLEEREDAAKKGRNKYWEGYADGVADGCRLNGAWRRWSPAPRQRNLVRPGGRR